MRSLVAVVSLVVMATAPLYAQPIPGASGVPGPPTPITGGPTVPSIQNGVGSPKRPPVADKLGADVRGRRSKIAADILKTLSNLRFRRTFPAVMSSPITTTSPPIITSIELLDAAGGNRANGDDPSGSDPNSRDTCDFYSVSDHCSRKSSAADYLAYYNAVVSSANSRIDQLLNASPQPNSAHDFGSIHPTQPVSGKPEAIYLTPPPPPFAAITGAHFSKLLRENFISIATIDCGTFVLLPSELRDGPGPGETTLLIPHLFLSDSNVVRISVTTASGTSREKTAVIREAGPLISDQAVVSEDGDCGVTVYDAPIDNWLCSGASFLPTVVPSLANRKSHNVADPPASGIDSFGVPGGHLINGYKIVPEIIKVSSWTDYNHPVSSPSDSLRRSASIVPSPDSTYKVRWEHLGGESIGYRVSFRFVGTGNDHVHNLFRRFTTEPKQTSCPGEE